MWQLGSWGCRLGAINGGLVVEIVGWAIYLAAWWLRLSVGFCIWQFGSLFSLCGRGGARCKMARRFFWFVGWLSFLAVGVGCSG